MLPSPLKRAAGWPSVPVARSSGLAIWEIARSPRLKPGAKFYGRLRRRRSGSQSPASRAIDPFNRRFSRAFGSESPTYVFCRLGGWCDAVCEDDKEFRQDRRRATLHATTTSATFRISGMRVLPQLTNATRRTDPPPDTSAPCPQQPWPRYVPARAHGRAAGRLGR